MVQYNISGNETIALHRLKINCDSKTFILNFRFVIVITILHEDDIFK